VVVSWTDPEGARPWLGALLLACYDRDGRLAWTEDNLLRQVVHQDLREDKPAAEVRRAVPHQKPPAARRRLQNSR